MIEYIKASGGDDTANINSALAQLQASGDSHNTLALQGSISTNATISISSDPGVQFEGVGCTWTQQTADTPTLSLANLSFGGANNITFKHASSDDNAIEVTTCENLEFGANLKFENYTSDGVVFGGDCTATRWRSRNQDAAIMVELLKEMSAESRIDYNHTVLSYDTTAINTHGASPYELLTSFWWYDRPGGEYDFSVIDPTTVAEGIISSRGNSGPAMMDIEEWDTETETEEAISNILKGGQMWRAGTAREIGFYRLIPHSSYWVPRNLKIEIDNDDDPSEIARLTALMQGLMDLDDYVTPRVIDYVDVLFPRVYTTYNNDTEMERWKWYALYSVLEARRIAHGRKVYPVVWWEAVSDGAPLSEARWIEMLQYVSAIPGIDGIAVYSGGTEPTDYTWQDAIGNLVSASADFA